MSTASATPALIKKVGAMHVQGVAGINFSVADEVGSNVDVTMQAVDADGNDLKRVVCLPWFLSADSLGKVIGSALSTAPLILSDGHLITEFASLSGMLVFEADGDAGIRLTDTNTNTHYLIIVLPDGSITASGAITHT